MRWCIRLPVFRRNEEVLRESRVRCTVQVRRWWLMSILGIAALLVTVGIRGQGLPVTAERLLNADKEQGNWMMYSRTYNGWRFSPLTQINTQTVKNLQVKWLFQGRHEQKF